MEDSGIIKYTERRCVLVTKLVSFLVIDRETAKILLSKVNVD